MIVFTNELNELTIIINNYSKAGILGYVNLIRIYTANKHKPNNEHLFSSLIDIIISNINVMRKTINGVIEKGERMLCTRKIILIYNISDNNNMSINSYYYL